MVVVVLITLGAATALGVKQGQASTVYLAISLVGSFAAAGLSMSVRRPSAFSHYPIVTTANSQASVPSSPHGCRPVADPALNEPANKATATFGRRDPRPLHPRWIVPDVPLMPAGEFRYPVSFFVLVKTGDLPFHVRRTSNSMTTRVRA